MLTADVKKAIEEGEAAVPKVTAAAQLIKDTKEIETQRNPLTNAYKALAAAIDAKEIVKGDEKKFTGAVAAVKKVLDPFEAKFKTSTVEAAQKLLVEGTRLLKAAELAQKSILLVKPIPKLYASAVWK